jgi:hypothetical protein
MNDSLTKLVYASILAGLILAFVNPTHLSHRRNTSATPIVAVAR